MSGTTKRERAEARAQWTIVRRAVDDATPVAPTDVPDAAEQLAAVERITMDTWALSGRSMPTYERHEMPGRLIRLDEDV